jgi:hypothetical protein
MSKVMLVACAALVLAVSANAEVVEKTTTTRYSGTIAEASPSTSTIIMKSAETPNTVKYIYNDKTVWEDAGGRTVRMETVRDQPATIIYEDRGGERVVTKVITQRAPEPKVIEQKTTTTTVTHESE